jgi:Glycosyltransferase family 10 (fucosyltransferase) C-term
MIYRSSGIQFRVSSCLIVIATIFTLIFSIQSQHPLRRRLQATQQHIAQFVSVDTRQDTPQVVSARLDTPGVVATTTPTPSKESVDVTTAHVSEPVPESTARVDTQGVVATTTPTPSNEAVIVTTAHVSEPVPESTPQVVSVDPILRIVRVGLRGWVNQFDLGSYSCPFMRCIYEKYESGQMDYDVLLNPQSNDVPWPPKKSSRTRHAEFNMESAANYAFVENHRNDVDVDIRYRPLKNANGFPFLQTSYIQAEMNAFMARDNNDNRWLDYEFRDPAMVVVISNCVTRRMDTLNNIVKGFSRVYKFGRCFEGHQSSLAIPETLQKCLSLPRREPVWDKPKECILQNVMFSYSVENSFEYGYITEKLWQALQMGAIPVYSLGVPENRDFLPHPDAALIIEDFASMEQLATYMHQVSKNRTLWFKHAMAWRYLPATEVSKHFISAVNNSIFTLPCRLCDWWSKDTREA